MKKIHRSHIINELYEFEYKISMKEMKFNREFEFLNRVAFKFVDYFVCFE